MKIPFTVEQFLEIFEKYNLSVWPMQIVLNLFGIAAIVLAIKKASYSDRIITIIQAFLWLWIGVVYHLSYFTTINKAAYGFAALYILQAMLFVIFGVIKPNLSFQYRPNAYGIMEGLLILYAMMIYAVLGYLVGHLYPKAPTFGVPCPTTIFTFGLLLWTDKNVPSVTFATTKFTPLMNIRRTNHAKSTKPSHPFCVATPSLVAFQTDKALV